DLGLWQPLSVSIRSTLDDLRTALARACLQVMFLAYQAWQMVHAIAITIVRVAVTHRKMLEWQTAASTANAWNISTISNARIFVDQMLAGPLLAALALGGIIVSRPRALAAAIPVLLLWAVAPLAAYRLSQPVRLRQTAVRAKDRRLLRLIARKTWRYFDAF